MIVDQCVTCRARLGRKGYSWSQCLLDVARHVRPHRALTPAAATVREATVEDAASIAAFDLEYSVRDAREEIERGISRVHVAQDDSAGSEVVGWLAAWLIPPHELQIIQITVSPATRRRGVGSMLIQTALDTYGPSVSQIVLEVREDNVAARGLYEKLGFVPLGAVRKNYYADGAGAVCMVLSTSA